jgi:hypothetical protein
MAINDKMVAQFEYQGGPGDVPQEVFFRYYINKCGLGGQT